MAKPISVGVVVPVYSGEAYLENLVSEVAALRDGWDTIGSPLSLDRLVLIDDEAIDRAIKAFAEVGKNYPKYSAH